MGRCLGSPPPASSPVSIGWHSDGIWECDGTSTAAHFSYPYAVAVDGSGNVYVADTYNFTARKITPAGIVTTLAGTPGVIGSADGTGSTAGCCLISKSPAPMARRRSL